MKKVSALIGGLFFATSTALAGCAGAPGDLPATEPPESPTEFPQQAAALPEATEPPPPPGVPVAEPGDPVPGVAGINECGCGDVVDDDANGICDLAEYDECRRAARGRCPCGMACTGGSC